MSPAPEEQPHSAIDRLLSIAGWVVQDMTDFNGNAAESVAVRELSLPKGACDFLRFLGGKACGVIEPKQAVGTVSGVAEQPARYVSDLSGNLARWADQALEANLAGRPTAPPVSVSGRFFSVRLDRTRP